ncbi:MAG: hypothetical protein ACLP3Q_27465, partial [Streptosporangiaceae bacterium]
MAGNFRAGTMVETAIPPDASPVRIAGGCEVDFPAAHDLLSAPEISRRLDITYQPGRPGPEGVREHEPDCGGKPPVIRRLAAVRPGHG